MARSKSLFGPYELDPKPKILTSRGDFDGENLSVQWQSLRVPADDSWLTLNARKGYLRLYGRESQHSRHEQSLVAKRLTDFVCRAETRLDYLPENYNQSAGLIVWYNTEMHFHLRVSHDETAGKVLGITLTDDGVYQELPESQIAVGDWEKIFLRADINYEELLFSASKDGGNWQQIGGILDMNKLADDHGSKLNFTGTFVTEQHYEEKLAKIEVAEAEAIKKANSTLDVIESDSTSSEQKETADLFADLNPTSDFGIKMASDLAIPPATGKTVRLLAKIGMFLAMAADEEALAGDMEERYRSEVRKLGPRQAKRNLFKDNLSSAVSYIKEWCRNRFTELFKFTGS